MTVFCVHSVIEHQQQQLAAEQLQTRASGTVRQGRRHGPSITAQISPELEFFKSLWGWGLGTEEE
jgi:hypothetical protein